MKISRRHATIGGVTLLAGISMGTSVQAQRDRPLKRAIEDAKEQEKVRSAERLTPKELASRTVYRRAVDAVIWGLPLVGEDTVKQAAFRDGKANYNDIVWWPKGGGWKNQSPTPNVNTRYMYFFINTKQNGPVVVELPPAVPGASFYGTIEDAWYVPLTDIGFEGKGGKYLILPPGYKDKVPDGYYSAVSTMNRVLVLLRAIPPGGDNDAANVLMQTAKVYPLNPRADWKAPDWVRLKKGDFTPLQWETNIKYWQVLKEIIDLEPADDAYRPYYGELAALGIIKGQPFTPDARMFGILERAAADANAQMRVQSFADRRADRAAWADRRWEWASLRPENGTFDAPTYLDLTAREKWFFQAQVESPAMFRRSAGAGSLYWLGTRGATGAFLDGANAYRLTVPHPVPGKLFWSVTVIRLGDAL